MLISVVVPVYKVEEYLSRCVDSILNQTFTDFELILVDDGKWITFIDSDDWVHADYLKILLDYAQKFNTEISICNFLRTSDYISDVVSKEKLNVQKYSSEEFFVSRNLNVVVAWGKLYKKYFFKDIRYPEGRLHEDVFTTYKLFAKADKISYINAALYFYYQNDDSIVHSSYSLRKLDEVEAGEEQVEFFKNSGNRKNLIAAYRRLMYYYSEHTRKLMQLPEGKPYAAKLKRKLAWLLITKARLCNVSVKSDTQYYETAFPVFMYFYWRVRKISEIFSKKKS